MEKIEPLKPSILELKQAMLESRPALLSNERDQAILNIYKNELTRLRGEIRKILNQLAANKEIDKNKELGAFIFLNRDILFEKTELLNHFMYLRTNYSYAINYTNNTLKAEAYPYIPHLELGENKNQVPLYKDKQIIEDSLIQYASNKNAAELNNPPLEYNKSLFSLESNQKIIEVYQNLLTENDQKISEIINEMQIKETLNGHQKIGEILFRYHNNLLKELRSLNYLMFVKTCFQPGIELIYKSLEVGPGESLINFSIFQHKSVLLAALTLQEEAYIPIKTALLTPKSTDDLKKLHTFSLIKAKRYQIILKVLADSDINPLNTKDVSEKKLANQKEKANPIINAFENKLDHISATEIYKIFMTSEPHIITTIEEKYPQFTQKLKLKATHIQPEEAYKIIQENSAEKISSLAEQLKKALFYSASLFNEDEA